jgi:hypothetical protein
MKTHPCLPPDLASQLSDLLESPPASSPADLGCDRRGTTGVKSFELLVTGSQGGPPTKRECKPPGLEARFGYYRRCQHLRKNGQPCKAPAMKGENICYSHAGQLDAERRRQQERRDLFSQPGVGLGDPNSIQRTLSAMLSAYLAGKMSDKTYGRLLIEVQTAICSQKASRSDTADAAPTGAREDGGDGPDPIT